MSGKPVVHIINQRHWCLFRLRATTPVVAPKVAAWQAAIQTMHALHPGALLEASGPHTDYQLPPVHMHSTTSYYARSCRMSPHKLSSLKNPHIYIYVHMCVYVFVHFPVQHITAIAQMPFEAAVLLHLLKIVFAELTGISWCPAGFLV